MTLQAVHNTVFPRETCVPRYALEQHVKDKPDDVFAVFEDGHCWTFRQFLDEVQTVGAGLQDLGVRQGDRVLMMLSMGKLALKTLFGINHIGAVAIPVNPAFTGRQLEHVIGNSGATVAVVESGVLETLLEHCGDSIKVILSSGQARRAGLADGKMGIHDCEECWKPGIGPRPLERDIEPWDLQSIIYTSGTTGPAKGALSTYMHSFSACNPLVWPGTSARDRHLMTMPIFHIGGTFVASMALCIGASIAVLQRFRTESFWSLARQMDATTVFLIGAMATFLLRQEPREGDRNHPLRSCIIVPVGGAAQAFHERFAVDVYTLFNMTEINTPIFSGRNPVKPGTCGRKRDGVDVRIVDGNDCEVPRGTAGQLLVRAQAPWSMSHGYNQAPEATAEAWRNGWFHTGDAFMLDEDGEYIFVDRIKDVIRRRGENISSYELESELLTFPGIQEAAAIPIRSEYSEDEVMIVAVPVAGFDLRPEDIHRHLEKRVAPYMLPRYIRIMDELPKTPTQKVMKQSLRDAGVTVDTWESDRPATRQNRRNA